MAERGILEIGLTDIHCPGQLATSHASRKKLVDGIVATAEKHGLPISGDYAGGMFGWYFVEGPVKNFAQATKADAEKFGKWHRAMLERGVYLAPSMYEAGFMSMAHTDADIERTIAIADEVMASL